MKAALWTEGCFMENTFIHEGCQLIKGVVESVKTVGADHY